jgi:hypothetical protein
LIHFSKQTIATPVNNSPAPASTGLRFRQVHLDFHTSGLIEEVAKSFDADQFASTLKKAKRKFCYELCQVSSWVFVI